MFKNKNKKFIRASLLIISSIFIAAGIFNGGARAVFFKAIIICMECIGLG